MDSTRTLYLGLVLTHLIGGREIETMFCRLGEEIAFPCPYTYEDQTQIPQLSVQWRSPHKDLLCLLIKHKALQNCSHGYAISYRPGSIRLTIQQVQPRDFGVHVCTVSKRHNDTASRIHLAESVTTAPTGGATPTGFFWNLLILQSAARLLVQCMVC